MDEDDKRWLDETAAEQGVPMTELVRRAIRLLRQADAGRPSRRDLLTATRGTWRHGDGLAWQERLRDEWEDRAR